jgi:hypothetical protein
MGDGERSAEQLQSFRNRTGSTSERYRGILRNSIRSAHNPSVPGSKSGGPTTYLAPTQSVVYCAVLVPRSGLHSNSADRAQVVRAGNDYFEPRAVIAVIACKSTQTPVPAVCLPMVTSMATLLIFEALCELEYLHRQCMSSL